MVLRRGGADLVSTGNLNSTQQETVDYLRANGIDVIGGPTADPAEHDRYLRGVLATKPDIILDNGGDLFSRWLEAPYEGLRGGTEETTSGRDRLLPLRERLAMPILVINDSPIKQFGENTHAVGAGTVESFIRITNRITNGRRVAVFGYGSVGRGVAAYFRGYNAIVSVVEPQPVLRLRALLDGFDVPEREHALREADIVITVTGAPKVITPDDLGIVRDGVVLVSAGHLPWELDEPALRACRCRRVRGRGHRRHHDARAAGRSPGSRPDPRAHGQSGGSTAARQFDRVHGPRVHAPGALPRGGRGRHGGRVELHRSRPGGHRRRGRFAVCFARSRRLNSRGGPMPYSVGPGEILVVLAVTALWAVPIAVVVLVVRSLRKGSVGTAGASSDPRAVLAQRLAAGQISRDEFDSAMRALGHADSAG